VDTSLAQGDLVVVEKEVNKKLKKRQVVHQMISPASSVDRHFNVPS